MHGGPWVQMTVSNRFYAPVCTAWIQSSVRALKDKVPVTVHAVLPSLGPKLQLPWPPALC